MAQEITVDLTESFDDLVLKQMVSMQEQMQKASEQLNEKIIAFRGSKQREDFEEFLQILTKTFEDIMGPFIADAEPSADKPKTSTFPQGIINGRLDD